MQKLRYFYLLTKPGISRMQLITVSVGYFVGRMGLANDWNRFGFLLFGTWLVASGVGTLNQWMERDIDARMLRTQLRVLPDGKLSPRVAMVFGFSLVLFGLLLLIIYVNLLVFVLSLVTAVCYLAIYTPMKQWTWVNTIVGAVPGALPILGGWAAATNTLHGIAWVLFCVLFAWQMPHFYALAIMYKDDYARGGFKMLPVIDETLSRTKFQMIIYTIVMIFASLILTYLNVLGWVYFAVMVFANLFFCFMLWRVIADATIKNARVVFIASIIYLPIWFVAIVVDILLTNFLF